MTRAMKDSGIEWIGEIPNDWKVLRNKNAFICSKEIIGSKSISTQLLSLTTNGIRTKTQAATGGKLPESFDTYQLVKQNDIVMCLFDLDMSAVFSGISFFDGMISPAYKVLKCKENIIPQYADYWFRFIFDGRKFKTYAKNLRYTLSFEEFGILPILIPDIKTQQKIAAFLDKQCSEIDAVRTKTKESIEEYKQLRNAIITQAVTKGIRPNRKMKASGIEWIGDIPEEWGIKKLRFVADAFDKGNGITKEDVFQDGDTSCIRYGEIYSKYNNSFIECFSRTNKEKIETQKYLKKGEILFAGTGELVEEIGKNIVYMGDEPCLVGGDIIILKHSQDPKFLNYALNSYYSQVQKSCGKTKLKVVHISASELKNILVFLPSIKEQQEIAGYLDEKCSEIDTLITKKEQLITELETYKKSLIYEYVTGKKEVK